VNSLSSVKNGRQTSIEKPRARVRWLIVSAVLLAAGVVLVVLGMRGPQVGPGIPGPIGRTSPTTSRPATIARSRVSKVNFSSLVVPGTGAVSTGSSSDSRHVKAASDDIRSQLPTLTAQGANSPVTSTRRDEAQVNSHPVHLSIPAIGLSDDVSELGLNADGSVQVPTSWNVPGWYKLGPVPGEKGSAVILGHVDSVNGPAAFYRLSSLRPGDQVTVRLSGGATVRFKVIGLRMYLKTKFPDQLVYGPRSYSALQLVTCGGAFDSTTHHYLSNLVVFTALVN
jgi:sortase (surface protein transpeptidase)